jgi:hypothetical protein
MAWMKADLTFQKKKFIENCSREIDGRIEAFEVDEYSEPICQRGAAPQ